VRPAPLRPSSAHRCGQPSALRFDKAAKPAQWRRIHEIADQMQPQIKTAFLKAVQGIKDDVKLKDLIAAAETGRIDVVLQILGLDTLYDRLANLSQAIRDTYQKSAEMSRDYLPKIEGLTVLPRFDITNPAAINFLRNYDFRLIQDLTHTTREGLRSVIANAFEYGGPVDEQARMIRNLIGLTDRQADAVLNYEQMLTDTSGYSPGKIESMVGAYADRQLNWRALTIARTESIRAAEAGKDALWRQMIANNVLDPSKIRRYWYVTPDDRLCPACEAVPDQNDDGVGMDEPFDTDNGPVMTPPLHPACRCGCRIEYGDKED
jgi:hypothetical protein